MMKNAILILTIFSITQQYAYSQKILNNSFPQRGFSFVQPICKSSYPEGISIGVEIQQIGEPISPVAYVELYLNGKLVGKDYEAPYKWTSSRTSYSFFNTSGPGLLTQLRSGTYYLHAKIKYTGTGIEDIDTEAISCTFYVKQKLDPSSSCLPRVRVLYPNDGQEYANTAAIPLRFEEYGPNTGRIRKVSLYVDGKLILEKNNTIQVFDDGQIVPFILSVSDLKRYTFLGIGAHTIRIDYFDRCGKSYQKALTIIQH